MTNSPVVPHGMFCTVISKALLEVASLTRV